MSEPNYLEELRNLENVVIDNGRYDHPVPNFDDLVTTLIDSYDHVWVGDYPLTEVSSGVVKDDYDSGAGYVIYSVGDKYIKIDYLYSSWDDPQFLDMYYVDKKVTERVVVDISYERIY